MNRVPHRSPIQSINLDDAPWRPERVDVGLWPDGHSVPVRPLRGTVSGSYRRYDEAHFSKTLDEFGEWGVKVLSPNSSTIDSEHQGFVYLKGDVSRDKRTTEDRHLDAISNSDFLWVMNKDGHLGLSTAFEMGYAHALRIPIYSASSLLHDPLGGYAEAVHRPRHAATLVKRADRAPKTGNSLLLNPEPAVDQLQGLVQSMLELIDDGGLPLSIGRAQELRALGRKCQRLLGALGV